MIKTFVSELEKALSHGLPGASAQRLMAPLRMGEMRRSYRHSEPPRESAVLILFYTDEERVKFPLIVRPTYPGVHSGQVSFPGGKYEAEDADLSVTALRETEEEIGVPREDIQIVGALSEHYIPPSNFNIQPYIGWVSQKPAFVLEEQEVDHLVEADLDDLLDSQLRKMKWIEPYDGVKIEAPYFDIQKQVVWGATAMILSELSEIIKRIPNGSE
ncbi:hypothetical protein BFP72_10705 [Reichenbachiella sp. 5M10]|uniref:NUDIX hydrolase n=1 Tax=Reichenbachiella sp. 5M10 TaxID=1889772 RepID=UPI000C5CF6D6|nr:CoA pyrophosphatase [Reichenbachiella sp. 5M10]PIB35827.1 hypothetical protein BFP72_10705 [Reichenbachiella sp. 5M10]